MPITLRSLIFAASLLLASCAASHSAETPPPAPAASPPAELPELAAARTLAGRYAEDAPPRYAGDGTRSDRSQFISTTLKAWIVANGAAWGNVLAAYTRAWSAAPTRDRRLAILKEALEVAERTAARYRAGANEAVPAEFLRDAETARTVNDAIAEVADNLWFIPVMRLCPSFPGGWVVECINLVDAKVSQKPRAPAPGAVAPKLQTGPGRYAVPDHPWSETHAESCAFAGSLRADGELVYADAQATKPLAKMQFSIDADRLVPPATGSDKGYEVVLRWPARGPAWLREGARVFALPEPVAAVPARVWADKGVPAAAHLASNGMIALTPEAGACKGCRRLLSAKPLPSELVACDAVALRRDALTRQSPDGEWRRIADQPIALADRPGGPTVATVSGGTMVLQLATSGGFAHVRSDGDPWSIDGWVRAANLGEPEGTSMIGLLVQEEGAPHKVIATDGAPVTLGASRTPTPLSLAAGELVFVTKRDGSACSVNIVHLEPAAAEAGFVVDCDRLEATSAKL